MQPMARVEIYTKEHCPYCRRALALLATKGVEPLNYEISMGGPRRAEMIERAQGGTTVPQIFIDGAHVGGCDDLMVLEAAGRLDGLLAA